MKPRTLLTITAAIEAGTGVALTVAPSWTVLLLLGSPFDEPASLIVSRILGSALFALGAACWLAPAEARGLIAAMLLYNIAVSAVLCYARFKLRMAGVALLPAVALHAVLSIWCFACLQKFPRSETARNGRLP
jgi:hypothetical protein